MRERWTLSKLVDFNDFASHFLLESFQPAQLESMPDRFYSIYVTFGYNGSCSNYAWVWLVKFNLTVYFIWCGNWKGKGYYFSFIQVQLNIILKNMLCILFIQSRSGTYKCDKLGNLASRNSTEHTVSEYYQLVLQIVCFEYHKGLNGCLCRPTKNHRPVSSRLAACWTSVILLPWPTPQIIHRKHLKRLETAGHDFFVQYSPANYIHSKISNTVQIHQSTSFGKKATSNRMLNKQEGICGRMGWAKSAEGYSPYALGKTQEKFISLLTCRPKHLKWK